MNIEKKKKILGAGIIFLGMIGFLCSCKKANQGKETAETPPANLEQEEKAAGDVLITAVIREINTKINSVTVFDVKDKQEYIFDYTGATDIRDQYDGIITMPEIPVGEIVDCVFKSSTQKLYSLSVSKEAWTYGNVNNLVTDKTKKRMKIGDRNYWYDEGLLIFSKEDLIELIDLHPKDELLIKGLDSQICSITVTTGHGYIRLSNYADFVGGTIEVGYGIITPIVENMMLVAREGAYNVTLENGELLAKKNIKLGRDEEVLLDLSEYHMEKERVGYVRFDIEPYGADLYINGILKDYAEPIKLNYGNHEIQVSMNGYSDFKGTLTIGESTPTIGINLAEGTYEVEKEDPESADDTKTQIDKTKEEPEETQEPKESQKPIETAEPTGTTSIDKDHTITVESPAGAVLYLNGKRKGTIPLSFTKEIGNHIIVLSQSGYLTKSYSVEVIEDGENVVLDFPDMIESE